MADEIITWTPYGEVLNLATAVGSSIPCPAKERISGCLCCNSGAKLDASTILKDCSSPLPTGKSITVVEFFRFARAGAVARAACKAEVFKLKSLYSAGVELLASFALVATEFSETGVQKLEEFCAFIPNHKSEMDKTTMDLKVLFFIFRKFL